MISKLYLTLGLVVLTFVAASTIEPASAAPSTTTAHGAAPGSGLAIGGPQTMRINGPAVCNCTSSDAELSVCHSETVEIALGSQILTVTTGQSASTCATQTVPPGTCLYFRYVFICRHTGFFGGWHCDLNSSGLHDRPSDPKTDC
ncbi:MAG: hypothetical protein ACI80N_003607 [Gammaproteobacteria bacterium]|jgi:hypothetical protein